MEKTKLGISVGMLGAVVYFSAALLGYISLFIVCGYILLVEKTEWLKKCVIKAAVLMLLYSLLSKVIGIIPQIFTLGSEEALFGNYYLYMAGVYQIVSVVIVVLNLVRIGLFIALGAKALSEKTIVIPIVDRLIDKYMDMEKV